MPTDSKNMLLHLVSDMMAYTKDGRELRQWFNDAPEQVMDTYGLSAGARQALCSMDRPTIGAFVLKEIQDWVFPPKEFPEGRDCPPFAGGGGPVLAVEYADPKPEVVAIDPVSAKVGDGLIALKVQVEGAVNRGGAPAKIRLKLGAVAQPDVPISNSKGTYRCSLVEGNINVPATAGKYTVVVVNDCGGGVEAEITSKVTFDVQP